MMNNAAIRQQLHQYIDTVDDKKAEALYLLLQSDIERKHAYSADELAVLQERAAKYANGEGKTYTVEESREMIRQQRKK